MDIKTVPFSVLAILLYYILLTRGLELPDYQTLQFSNPSRNLVFTRLAIHNETGDVYIGGADRLYRLGADFTRKETVNTFVACEEENCPINYNKILLVDYEGNTLVTCGSESVSASDPSKKPGTCQTRALDSILEPLRDDGTSVVPSGKLTTEAIIAPGPLNGGVNTLYVAATFDDTRYGNYLVSPVTRRVFSASTTTDLIFNTESDAEIVLYNANYPDVPFIINYIYAYTRARKQGISPSDYTYFVTTQRQDFVSRGDRNYVSKINRVCQTGYNHFDSYAEITLDCQGADSNNKYNLIQAAYIGPAGDNLATSMGISSGNDVFYGVFAKTQGVDGDVPSSQSALCVFKLLDIEERFIDGIHGCLNDGGDFRLNYLQSTNCRSSGGITREQAEAQQCSAINWALADNFNPFTATAVIEWSDVVPSSIVTATNRDHTIAFVGTSDGNLVKVHVENITKGREYERFHLDNSPVLRDNSIDESQEMVTFLTEQKLTRLRTSNCGAYKTCFDCIGDNGGQDGDPYCGWCALEESCKMHNECPMADVSTRWLPYNSAQCVRISSVTPYPSQPMTSLPREIILQVEQLPELSDGNEYRCVFDDIDQTLVNHDGDQLTCITPAIEKRPLIPDGSDNVRMKLAILSTESGVKFASTDYDFYECNNHKMCVACTNSSWACDWCIYSNTCTHDNNTCTEDTGSSIVGGVNNPDSGPEDGFESCPQLEPQDSNALISVGGHREIKARVQNLPSEKVTSYECRLYVEDEEQTTSAFRNDDVITCVKRAYSFNEAVHMLDVRLSVVWNGNRMLDDIMGYDVTLYKCDIGRPDCSRCLSNLTTMQNLGCGWCQSAGVCSVQDSPDCSIGWIPPKTIVNCPSPAIFAVNPVTGPQEGGTIIAISGTDLGQKFADVLLVTIGGEVCAIEGLEDHYVAGSSISCLTVSGGIDKEAEIAVRIMGSDGNPQDSVEGVIFTYRSPYVSSFKPYEGLAAGGTVVTIEGMYLDAGYEITVMIGSECTVDRDSVTETSATCRTSGGNSGEKQKVIMSFDGATRESENEFTYQPNSKVIDVQPRSSIQSGGRTVRVAGTNLRLAQTPMMVVYSGELMFTDRCSITKDTLMTCTTPRIPMKYTALQDKSHVFSRKKRAADTPIKHEFGFVIGDVQELLEWSVKKNATLDYYADPVYDSFKADPETYNGSILILTGQNFDSASSEQDVQVYVGPGSARVQSLDERSLICRIPETNPGAGDFKGNETEQGLPIVSVIHGNLEFKIGRLKYVTDGVPLMTVLLSTFCALFAVVLLAVVVWYNKQYRSVIQTKKELLDRLRSLQQQISEIQALGQGGDQGTEHKSVVLPNNVRIEADDVRIAYSQLTIGKALGNGAFGKVFEASLRSLDDGSSRTVAIKTIKDASEPSVTIKFLEEGLIMKDFKHENVLGLIGLTFDPEGNPIIIIPLMANGDLKTFLKKAPMELKKNTLQLASFGLDAAKGMEYLAGRKFVHRDLAARNCMIDENLTVKIADFGLSRDLEDSDDYISQDLKAKLPVKWMAPESLDRKLYNEKTDVWSFGILLWEIFSHGARPYVHINNREVYYYLQQGNRLPQPLGCHKDMFQIMLQCWEMQPVDRPAFSELVSIIASYNNTQQDNHGGVNAVLPSDPRSNPGPTGGVRPDFSPNEGGEHEELIIHQSYFNMSANSYLELDEAPEAPYLEPMEHNTRNDDVVIELHARPTDPEVNEGTASLNAIENQVLISEDTPVDYVNESVLKFRTNTSFI